MKTNREQKRKLNKNRSQKYTPEQIELAKLIFLRDQCKGRFKEGDKVKLNIEFMMTSPDWGRKLPDYRLWCHEHRDKELTVVYDAKHMKDAEMVCLEEDNTTPKWLFSVIDLMPASGDDGFMDMIKWVGASYKKTKENPVS